jgi:hypothetical protein
MPSDTSSPLLLKFVVEYAIGISKEKGQVGFKLSKVHSL